MDKNIASVFADECKHLVIDQRFARKLHSYQVGFVFKNADHSQFFGGNLTGVQTVRFVDSDRDRWFEEILEVDDGPLEARLYALPTINAEFKVSSDVMNLSCAWLLHAIYVSSLPEKIKHEAMIDVVLVLQYKFLTSRLFRHFKYNAEKSIAEAVFAAMSRKFVLKEHGNWSALLRWRAETLIDPKEKTHRNAIVKMDDDLEVVYLLNDTQGRIRGYLKSIYDLHLTVKAKGDRIHSTSSVVEHDGVEILRDKTKSLLAYGRYMNSIITDKNSFIREELVSVILKLVNTMPEKLFRESLEWMSDNYRLQGAGNIEELMREILVHAFDYLAQNRALLRNNGDLPNLLVKLKGIYTASRSTDPALLSLREGVEALVRKATGSKSKSSVASVRTGIMLYIVVRAFTMKHFSAGA